jgi:aryl-alcohol dehydrogenase-like predicted oxidoreductase
MEMRPLGKTGFEVSALGFGGGPVGFDATGQETVTEVLNTLLDRGLNLIDTAAAYKGSEEAIGKAVSGRRDEYVLVSKCGRPDDEIKGEPWSAEVVSATVDRALRRLRTDRLDVMLLHSCELEILERGEAIGALLEAREAGKIRHLGYSGDNEAAVWAAKHPEVAVIETSVNICDQANVDTVLRETRGRAIGVLAKRPIANGAWRRTSEISPFYLNYSRDYAARLSAMGVTPADLGFDGDPAQAWPEIALRFTLAQAGVTTAIVGTTRETHLKANLAAAEKGPLPADAVEILRAAFRKAEAASGETWPGLR